MLTLKKKHEVIAIIDYELEGLEDRFIYRLEVYKSADIFTGAIFKFEYYNLEITFPVHPDMPDKSYGIDSVPFFVEEDTIDNSDLVGKSKQEIITIFEHKLEKIWNCHTQH